MKLAWDEDTCNFDVVANLSEIRNYTQICYTHDRPVRFAENFEEDLRWTLWNARLIYEQGLF